jgi:hypothetical protein
MHGREGRHDRSRPDTSLAGRILIGALMGAFLGLLELWFYEFDLAHLLAAIAAGATFGSLTGVSIPWVAPDHFKEVIVCSSAGCIAGIVWWLIAQPGSSIGSIALSVGIGAILGALFAVFD